MNTIPHDASKPSPDPRMSSTRASDSAATQINLQAETAVAHLGEIGDQIDAIYETATPMEASEYADLRHTLRRARSCMERVMELSFDKAMDEDKAKDCRATVARQPQAEADYATAKDWPSQAASWANALGGLVGQIEIIASLDNGAAVLDRPIGALRRLSANMAVKASEGFGATENATQRTKQDAEYVHGEIAKIRRVLADVRDHYTSPAERTEGDEALHEVYTLLRGLEIEFDRRGGEA